MACDLGEMRIEVVAVDALEQVAHFAVQLHPTAGREVVVQRLAHQVMGEGAPPRHRRQFADDADCGGLGQHLQQSRGREEADALQDLQVELAADHGGHPQRGHRFGGEPGHPPADQRSHLLRDAQERIAHRLAEPMHVTAFQQPHHLAHEERVAGRDLVQPGHQLARGPLSRDGGHVRLHIRGAKPAQGNSRADPRQLGEDVAELAHTRLPVTVRRHQRHPRIRQRVGQEPQQQQ